MAHLNLQNIVNGGKRRGERNAQKIIVALLAAGERGCTTKELADWTGFTRTTCLIHLHALRARDEAHRGRPKETKRAFVDVWRYGPEPAEVEAIRADPVETEMKADIAAAHAEWARNWRAYRPVEAAWIQG